MSYPSKRFQEKRMPAWSMAKVFSPTSLACVVIIVASLIAQPAHAQFQAIAAAGQPMIPDRQFDSWVFQNLKNETICKEVLEGQLDNQIELIESYLSLSDDQEKKIKLAGRGDMRHFFDQVEIHRAQFRALQSDRKNANVIFQKIQPLQLQMQKGLFTEDSLFQKVLLNTLDEGQRKKHEDWQKKREARLRLIVIRTALAEIEQLIPLLDHQRKELLTVLTENTNLELQPSAYLSYYMRYQIGLLDTDAMKSVLDENQLKAFKAYAAQGHAYKRFLQQQGLLADD